MARKTIASRALVRYLRCIRRVLEGKDNALEGKVGGKHIWLEREFKDKAAPSGEELCILIVSNLDVRMNSDISMGMEIFPNVIVRKIEFRGVNFVKEHENDSGSYSRSIKFGGQCKLILEGCKSNVRVEIHSEFKSTQEDREVTYNFPQIKKQDSAGVEIKGCDFGKEVKVGYVQNTKLKNDLKSQPRRSYGKFYSEKCKFPSLEIDLSKLQQGPGQAEAFFPQDFIMILNQNTIKKRLIVAREDDSGRFKAKLTGGNCIKNLRFKNKHPDVIEWGLEEKIGERLPPSYSKRLFSRCVKLLCSKSTKRTRAKHKEYRQKLKTEINQTKQELMWLRKGAVDKGDRLQESIINCHISKCDEQLILLEGCGMWRENLVMWAGRYLSDHGKSWTSPLRFLLCTNIVLSFILLSLPGVGCAYGGFLGLLGTWISVTIELFNPLSTTSSFSEFIFDCRASNDSICLHGGVGFVLVVSKAIYAICIYEFVRAARRFTYR